MQKKKNNKKKMQTFSNRIISLSETPKTENTLNNTQFSDSYNNMFWFFSIPVKKLENVGVFIECKDWNIYKMALITGSDKVNDKECTVRKVLKNSIEKS